MCIRDRHELKRMMPPESPDRPTHRFGDLLERVPSEERAQCLRIQKFVFDEFRSNERAWKNGNLAED
eukprot:15043377-Alexandrium_andersonii.AAC.1